MNRRKDILFNIIFILFEEIEARSDADGVVKFVIDKPGNWYVEFINMVPVTAEDLDYESKWATLAFEMR